MRLKKHLFKGVFKRLSSKPSTPQPSNQVSTTSGPSLFAILPAELCIFILTDAAKVSQIDKGENPYSTAFALCRVSRTVRLIILPELLHTVLLSKSKNVVAFMHALKMQKSYELKGNDLYVDYPSHVRNIWIGQTSSLEYQSIDVSLLAPVLFAAKSLALGLGSIPLLDRCLTQVWKSPTRFKFFKRRKSSRAPWSTTTLTLVGNLESYQPTTRYAVETLRSTFFAFIAQFIFLPPMTFYFVWRSLEPEGGTGRAYLPAPTKVDKFPWTSLKNPQTALLACPVITPPGGQQLGSRDVKALPGLLKVPTPLWDNVLYNPAFIVDALLPCNYVVTADVEWEQTWAYKLSDEEPSKLANGLVELSNDDINTDMTWRRYNSWTL